MAVAETHAVIRNSRVLIASSDEGIRRQWIGNPENDEADFAEAAGGADALVTSFLGIDRNLKVRTLDPLTEDEPARAMESPGAAERPTAPGPPLLVRLLDGLLRVAGDPAAVSLTILHGNGSARFHSRQLSKPFLGRIVEVSPAEIPLGTAVQSPGVVE